MTRPPFEKLSASMAVNGQGPATHESLAFRNSFPSPASSDADAMAAFHSIPGEQGGLPSQRTFPLLTTENVLTALPTLTAVFIEIDYRTEIPVTLTAGPCVGVSGRVGTMWAT